MSDCIIRSHSASADLTPPNGALIHLAYYLKTGETGTHQIEERLEEMMDTLQPGWREKASTQALSCKHCRDAQITFSEKREVSRLLDGRDK